MTITETWKQYVFINYINFNTSHQTLFGQETVESERLYRGNSIAWLVYKMCGNTLHTGCSNRISITFYWPTAMKQSLNVQCPLVTYSHVYNIDLQLICNLFTECKDILISQHSYYHASRLTGDFLDSSLVFCSNYTLSLLCLILACMYDIQAKVTARVTLASLLINCPQGFKCQPWHRHVHSTPSPY